MDGMCRTDRDALTTQTALRMVDVREVVCDGDGFKLTLFKAERATYAGITTCLFRGPAFILIATADEDTSTLRSFLAEFDERLGAGLDTGRRVSGSIAIASKLHDRTQSPSPTQPQEQSVSPL